MLIASWNVNSITVRLPHLLDWLKSASPDHLCLQELKTVEEKFPFDQLSEIGYSAHVVGEKTYNGVASVTVSAVSGAAAYCAKGATSAPATPTAGDDCI